MIVLLRYLFLLAMASMKHLLSAQIYVHPEGKYSCTSHTYIQTCWPRALAICKDSKKFAWKKICYCQFIWFI